MVKGVKHALGGHYSGGAVFRQLCFLLVLFLSVLCGSHVLGVTYAQDQHLGAALVNGAGLQRMMMTRFAFYSAGLLPARAAQDRQAYDALSSRASEMAELVGLNFEGFIEGGKINLSADGHRVLSVPAFEDPQIVMQLKSARSAWQRLRDEGNIPYEAENTAADAATYAALEEALRPAVIAQDAAVREIEAYFTAKNDNLMLLQRATLAAGGAVFLFSVLYAWFFVARRIEASRQAVEAANAAKSEFLAHMSHELRTPLNSIIGMSRLVYEDKSVSAETGEMVGVVYRSARNLLAIVNHILDLSKIEAREIKLEVIPFAVQEVTNNVMETMLPVASAKGLTLSCKYKGDDVPYLVGDPLRVGQILMNLVGNAVKYTTEGAVSVIITGRRVDDTHVEVSFAVSDTGIGIPPDKLDSVFDKFSQADTSITRRFGGTGLGLNITRAFTEMMGGTITVTSALGVGSCFTAAITFETTATRPVEAKHVYARDASLVLPIGQRKPLGEGRFLLAEDHAMNQAYMRKLFEREGITHYDLVSDGAAALRAFEEKAYDVIVTDCHMPEMSGYDLSRRIRALEKITGKHIPIVAMTADAMLGSREKCIEAGMDDYVAKPIDRDEFKAILRRWFIIPGLDDANPSPAPAQKPASIDVARLADFADNEAQLRDFVALFVQQSSELLESLKAACVDGHSDAWVDAAHKLKGSAAMLGAVRMTEACARAQAMTSASAAERRAQLKEIANAYTEARVALDAQLAARGNAGAA